MRWFLLLACFIVACGGESRPRASSPTPRSCTRTTCSQTNLNCGAIPDGCGGTVSCGVCEMGQSCGATGVPNICGEGSCAATTCEALGADCGQVSDGCAGVLGCGTCAAPLTCGGTGTPNVCGGCVPDSCQPGACGTIPNGCGGNLNCGGCSGTDICHPNNQCGPPGCMPTTCQAEGFDCGGIDDGCGTTLNCGSCANNDLCSANVCQCTPTTCAALGADCGSVADGCGATLECGSCMAPLACGGGGAVNTCGATCASCPTGYSCDPQGVCIGGSPTNLNLNVSAPGFISISGTVRLNNGAPNANSTSTLCARVTLTNLDNFDDYTANIDCNTWQYAAVLHAGNYRIRVSNYSGRSSFPDTSQEIHSTLGLNSTQTLDLNVTAPQLIDISGVVTLNGQPPNANSSSTLCARVTLTNLGGYDDYTANIDCNTWRYTARVHAGSYQVEVANYSSRSNLPDASREVHSTIGLNGSGVLDLNVTAPPFIDISGIVRLNNGAPNANSSSTLCARVTFSNLDGLDSYTSNIDCSTWQYSARLHAGRYRVRVQNYSGRSNLPDTSQEIHSSINLMGSQSLNLNVVAPQLIDISGVVTLNGGAPAANSSSSLCARVTFTNLDDFDDYTANIDCTTWQYTARIHAGNYRIEVVNYSSRSNLPDTGQEVFSTLNLAGSQTRNFDVVAPQYIEVSGVVRLNNGPPTAGSSSTLCARVTFTNLGNFDDSTANIDCTTWQYSAVLHAGDYRVRVQNYSSRSNLPDTTQTVHVSTNLASTQSLNLNVTAPPLVNVSGVVTLNGGTPTASSSSTLCARVSFSNLEGFDDATANIDCNTWQYSAVLHAGLYRVEIANYSARSDLPDQQQTTVEVIRLP